MIIRSAPTGMGLLLKTAFFVCIAVGLLISTATAQQLSAPKRVLVLYWYDKDYPWNHMFDQSFQTALKSASQKTEYYAEYLDINRFPVEKQAPLLRDYLRQKYAETHIDVLVATSDVSLDFFTQYRAELFPATPIVFVATRVPPQESLTKQPGMTGIIIINAYRKTLDLALKLHPDTEQVFIISGTLERDKRIENLAKADLQGYEGKVAINYLTDIPPEELLNRTRSLPGRSVLLYVWQQSIAADGKVIESMDILGSIARSVTVPVYKLSTPSYAGSGVVGGYINAAEANGTKAAEMALRIANGALPSDISIQSAPTVLEFDWRQLQRWRISDSELPAESIVRFKEVTFWSQYKGRILAAIAIILFEALLIAALLFERSQRWRATRKLAESEHRFRSVANSAPVMIWMAGPDKLCTWVNEGWLEFTGRSITQELGNGWLENVHPQDRNRCLKTFQEAVDTRRRFSLEYRLRRHDGTWRWILSNGAPNHGADEEFVGFLGSCIDVTENKMALDAVRKSEERFAKVFNANAQPMSLTTLDDGTYLDVNERFLEMSEYTRAEIIGRKSVDVGVFDSKEHRWKLLVEPLLRTGSSQNFEMNFRMKSGGFRMLLSSAELIELAGKKCIVVASSDITERKEAEQRLAELTGRLLRTQDEERRNIARELHDVTAQGIGLILLNLAQVQRTASTLDTRSKDKLVESLALGEQALKEIRTLSYVLHPPLLDQAGLLTALEWYVKGFSERSGVKVDFSHTVDDGERMGSDVEYALFRVVQECLTNIRRHTNSETAQIILTQTSAELVLTVRDEGKGQKLYVSTNGDGVESVGVGIPGMRYRLKQLGGDLNVQSDPYGTTVTARVPVTTIAHDSSIANDRAHDSRDTLRFRTATHRPS